MGLSIETATTEDGAGVAGSRGSRKVLRMRSLVISPNLDKLLEHEERSNATETVLMCSPTTTFPTVLPPPPRKKNRRMNSRPRSRTVTELAVGGQETLNVLSPLHSPSRSSNPYINPAPTASELFLSLSHASSESARPDPRPSQQSVYCDDQQHLSSCLPTVIGYRFKGQTLVKGGKFPGSPILRFLPNSLDHGRARTLIPRTGAKADCGRSSNTIEFKARFGISSPTKASSTLSNNSLDHLSVIEICSLPNLDNQPSSPEPMTTTTADSPKFGPKPPLPTTPKPVFSRHPSLRTKKPVSNGLPSDTTNAKPATTNFLDGEERADLVRKSRKLTRLFGETPNAEAVVNQAAPTTSPAQPKKSELDAGSGSHRPDRMNTFGRRYSLPLGVDDVPILDFGAAVDNLGSPALYSNRSSPSLIVQPSSRHEASSIRPHSPTSFIEMSDDGSSNSVISRNSVASSYLSKTASIDLLEEERRRKRERLAKLYRYLGSQVPINLALGIDDDSPASLPPTYKHRPSSSLAIDNTSNRRNALLRRRRSSSAIPNLSTWSDDVERLKADLDDREKAIIVRRAQKMEKLFGVAPPLTLYHPSSASAPSSGSVTPATFPLHPEHIPFGSSTPSKKENRPDTPESSKHLLHRRIDSSASLADLDNQFAKASRALTDGGHSVFYRHYEHSLNSLTDIIDRDDKKSLAEFHQTLRGDLPATVSHGQSAVVTYASDKRDATPTRSGHRSCVSSLLSGSERRVSIPATTSMISLDSEHSISVLPPKPDATSFQQRRKRAAKLTHFFGVDYRELFDDVLDSIENDMQLGQREGMLRAEEVEDLLQKLRKLRYRRQNFL